jgi:nitrogen regulatory protein PII-like uncharacterized protein
MPKPRKGETRSKFMGRCISDVINEGKKRDQAIAQCINVWKESHNASLNLNVDDGVTAHYDVEYEVIVGYSFDEEKYTKEEAEKWMEIYEGAWDQTISLINEIIKEELM